MDKKLDHKRKAVMVDEKLKKRALRYYHRCRNVAKTLGKYAYCSRSALYTWLKNEGFFGTIRNEMFCNEGRARMTVKKFIPYLENYLNWFKEKRIKESLGHESVIDRMREIGVAW